MSYEQDNTRRVCAICGQDIQLMQKMIDLFRAKPGNMVEWVHEVCAQNALEIFLLKKRARKEA